MKVVGEGDRRRNQKEKRWELLFLLLQNFLSPHSSRNEGGVEEARKTLEGDLRNSFRPEHSKFKHLGNNKKARLLSESALGK